jgi:hypothetical protein
VKFSTTTISAAIWFGISTSAVAQWIAGPALPTAGAPREYAAGVRRDADVFAIGGTPFLAGEEGSAHRWTSGAPGFVAVATTEGWLHHLGAAVDSLGRIVVFGGANTAGEVGEAYVWDPSDGNKGSIAKRSQQAPAQLFAVAADAQGRIYAMGGGPGDAATAQDPNSARVDRYDAIANAWTQLPAMPTPVADAAACHDGQGRIVVIGGYDALGHRSANVAVFDVGTSQWSDDALPDLPVALAGHRAALGSDGRIYVVGGHTGVTVPTTYVLDLAQLVWSAGPSLAIPRRHFALALGPDDHLIAMGGRNEMGGTNASERLFTPPCPSVTAPPAATQAFLGGSFGLSLTVVGGAPISHRWRKDGVPLGDGPSQGGGTIVGATTDHLAVLLAGAADAGDYDCVVANACGSTTSAAASVTLVPPAAIPPSFEITNLHPPGTQSSSAAAVEGDLVGGAAFQAVPPYSGLSRPILWSAADSSSQDLTPVGSVGGGITSIAKDGTLAGWWWWPYTTPQGTGYYTHACVWPAAGAGHVDVQPTGWEIGSLGATDGTHHVGTMRFDESSTHADGFYWPGTSKFAVELTPAGFHGSSATALDGDLVFGNVHLAFGVVHAAKWQGGSGASFVDLNPPGSTWSYVLGAGDGQQVGRATIAGTHQAGMWSGDASNFVSLHPQGAAQSVAVDAEGGLQVGSATIGGVGRAMLWAGTALSAVDLHAMLGADYAGSGATALDVAPDGSVTIVGSASRLSTGRVEAVMWRGTKPALTQDLASLSVQSGGQVRFALAAGAANAGRTYLILGSATGTSPGIPLGPGLVLPLVPDAYLGFTFAVPNSLILPSLGTLDAEGAASATLALPGGVIALPSSLDLHHAFVVFGPFGAAKFASNAVNLTLLP